MARKSSTRQFAPRTHLGTGTELPLTVMATAVTPLSMNTQWAGLLVVMEASACSSFPSSPCEGTHCLLLSWHWPTQAGTSAGDPVEFLT